MSWIVILILLLLIIFIVALAWLSDFCLSKSQNGYHGTQFKEQTGFERTALIGLFWLGMPNEACTAHLITQLKR
jgi:hypothetical protein